jgi:hypothetical protein
LTPAGGWILVSGDADALGEAAGTMMSATVVSGRETNMMLVAATAATKPAAI